MGIGQQSVGITSVFRWNLQTAFEGWCIDEWPFGRWIGPTHTSQSDRISQLVLGVLGLGQRPSIGKHRQSEREIEDGVIEFVSYFLLYNLIR